MKIPYRQILASSVGAVLAALIASSFGVTGTIIGVAIGSAAATIGSALVAQSIERGQHAVKQVAVRVQDNTSSPLLRRLGGTDAAGGATSSSSSVGSAGDAAPTEVVGPASERTTEMQSVGASADETNRLEISAAAEAPATERLDARTVPVPTVAQGAGATGSGSASGNGDGNPGGGWLVGRKFSWKAIAGTSAVVFVLALLLITAIELIAGKPLAAIFGSNDTGPTITNLGGGSSRGTTTTTTTSPAGSTTTSTSTTPSSSTTTTSSSSSSTTSTTTPGATTTTTSSNLGATTSTTTPQANTTTTTVAP